MEILEYFFHSDDINRTHRPETPGAQERLAIQVLEGRHRDEEDIIGFFDEVEILPTRPASHCRLVVPITLRGTGRRRQ